jgi:hypothetical protein
MPAPANASAPTSSNKPSSPAEIEALGLELLEIQKLTPDRKITRTR